MSFHRVGVCIYSATNFACGWKILLKQLSRATDVLNIFNYSYPEVPGLRYFLPQKQRIFAARLQSVHIGVASVILHVSSSVKKMHKPSRHFLRPAGPVYIAGFLTTSDRSVYNYF